MGGNADQDLWIGKKKREYSYDESGHETSLIMYFWDSAQNNWIFEFKENRIYNESGKLVLYISYHWEISQNAWAGVMKLEYIYDEFGIESRQIKICSSPNNPTYKIYYQNCD